MPEMMSNKSLITVIIPVYHDWGRLELTLSSLENQKCSDLSFEVIVVNNDPLDPFPESLNLYENVVCISESKLGSYAARNKGISIAKGDVLAFTDSDCLPSPSWLENIATHIAPGEIISGKVELQVVDFKNYWELFDKAAHMRNDKSEAHHSIATANMAVYKSDFFKVGLFQEVTSGGDYAWSQNARRCGLDVRYFSDVLVYHPTRKSYVEIEKKMLRITKGYAELNSDSSYHAVRGLAMSLIKVPILPREVNLLKI